MKRTKALKLALACLVTAAGPCLLAADAAPPGSVNDVMTNVITPLTNTIWGIEDPQTDEEWRIYVNAAAELIEASQGIRAGGTGPNDATWAADEAWTGFADALIASAEEIKAAAEARDLDTFVNASNDKMYPPCEECHQQFHPGVAP